MSPTEGDTPYFFLSYTRTPESGWVKKLFNDVSAEVFERTTASQPVGFIDEADIPPGHRWRPALEKSLSTCRVFVPLCSPRFFASRECGYEWNAIEQRILAHRARHRGDPQPIVPALWLPVDVRRIPEVARRIQLTHADFGAEYVREGFYTLIKNSRFKESYDSAVRTLALQIIRAAERPPVLAPMPAGVDLARVNAFAVPDREASGASRISIVVAAPTSGRLPAGCSAKFYGRSSLDWNPFQPDAAQTIAECALDVAAFNAFQPQTLSFEEGYEVLRRKDPQAGVVLLVVDAWCGRDEYLASRLRELDTLDLEWVGVVVASNRDNADPARAAELMAELRDVMPRRLGSARSSLTALAARIASADQFRNRLPEVLATAFNACIDHVAAYPPTGSENVGRRPSLDRPHQQRPDVRGGGTGGSDGQ